MKHADPDGSDLTDAEYQQLRNDTTRRCTSPLGTLRGDEMKIKCNPQPPPYLTGRGEPEEIMPGIWTWPARVGTVSAVRSDDCVECPISGGRLECIDGEWYWTGGDQ